MKKRVRRKELEEYVIDNKENFYRLAFSYVKNEQDALDIIQESIHKAMTSIQSLKDVHFIKSWFYRILVNTSLDMLRKRRRLQLVDQVTIETYQQGSEDTYKDWDLQRALDQLDPDYRIIVILRYFEDLKLNDISEILDLNINTVKTRLYQALKHLRITIENSELEEEHIQWTKN